MRFDESDEREAYRRGARDCFESFERGMGQRQARAFEAWLKELDAWEYGEPPPPPLRSQPHPALARLAHITVSKQARRFAEAIPGSNK